MFWLDLLRKNNKIYTFRVFLKNILLEPILQITSYLEANFRGKSEIKWIFV